MIRPPPFTGLLAFAAWIAAEIAVFNLLASWTGGGMAFFLLVMKSVLGAIFVQRAVRQKLFSLLQRRTVVLDGAEAAAAWLKGLGGALLIIPGFVAGVLGLALLNPSIRRAILARSGVKASNPRDIDLGQGDWSEVSGERSKRIPRSRPAGDA